MGGVRTSATRRYVGATMAVTCSQLDRLDTLIDRFDSLFGKFISLFAGFISLFDRLGNFDYRYNNISGLPVPTGPRERAATGFSQYFPVDQGSGRPYPPSSFGMKKTSEPGRSGWK
jgi:hypothetical protein